MNNLHAVLWDLDGTIIDSEPYWLETEAEIAERYGAVWTEENALASIGNPIEITCRELQDAGVPLSVAELTEALFRRMDERIRAGGLPYRPGVAALMAELHDAGVRQALVTMSFGSYVTSVCRALPADYLDVVRTGDSVARGKPDPLIYHAAAADLGIPMGAAIAVEDSPAGIGAILASGATPLGVRRTVALAPDPRLIARESLEGVTLADLQGWHRDWQSRWAGA